jgi:DNA repair protein RadA/Sms
VDLAIVAAIASSFLDKPVPERTLVMGEVGLTGEVRAIGQAENRIAEAHKMGFTRCVLPHGNIKRLARVAGMDVAGVRTVSEAVEAVF